MAKVAIITRTRNRPRHLRRALRSILAQSFEDWHVYLVDTSPEKYARAIVEETGGGLTERTTILEIGADEIQTRGSTINRGIRAGSEPLITLLDDDDTWAENFLTDTVKALEEKPFETVRGIVCRSECLIEKQAGDDWEVVNTYILNPDLEKVTLGQLAVVNRFCTNAFLYEREAFDAIGGYSEEYLVLEDWGFNLEFVKRYEIHVIPEILSFYHLRHESDAAADNSQTLERSLHKLFEAKIVNDAIRAELEDGKPGLGSLLNQGVMTREILDRIHRIESRLKTIGEKVGKIDSRSKLLKDNALR